MELPPQIDDFFDHLSSLGFRPLILQPSCISSHSSTLIDNIFINNHECQATGGNLTCSISDHLMQFSQIDIFDKIRPPKIEKYTRNWRIFNKDEFKNELLKLDLSPVLDQNTDTNSSFNFLMNQIDKLLDEMAPFKKLTKKEIGLKQTPWITSGLLVSMKERSPPSTIYQREK